MTRKLKFILTSLFITGWFLIFEPSFAHAEDVPSTTPVLVIPDPLPTLISINVIETQDVQNKINSSISTLSQSAELNGQELLKVIQDNNNIDKPSAISIATTQEPIATAVLDASNKDQSAYNAIQIAQSSLDSAVLAKNNVINQSAIVISAQSSVDSATAIVQTKTIDLANATSAVDSQTAVVATDTTDVASKQTIVDSATATVAVDTTNVNNAIATKSAADAVVASNTQSGLNMTVKQDIGYNNAPPVFIGNTTLTTTVSQINQNWGSGGPANTYSDDFQVKYDGQITSTTTGNIQFYAPADDGVKLYLDNTLVINDWYDKGGGGSVSSPIAFTANTPKAITLYFYENGGGANVQLQWNKGNGWQVVPSTAFSRSSATQAQIDAATAAANALNTANATLATDISALNAAQTALTAAQNTLLNDQITLDTLKINQTIFQNDLTVANESLTVTTATLTLEQQNLKNMQETATVILQTANTLADAATNAVQIASNAMDNAVQIAKDYYAEQQRVAIANSQAQSQPAPQPAVNPEPIQGNPQTPATPVAQIPADTTNQTQPSDSTDSSNAPSNTDGQTQQDSTSQPSDSQTTNGQTDNSSTGLTSDTQATDTTQSATDQSQQTQPSVNQTQTQDNNSSSNSTTDSTPGMISDNPNSLPDITPKLPDQTQLIAHVQVDKAGVENGGIEFFGTKSQPQVIGEDGKLTPPPPPPGSGLPIPPDAITLTSTFIGQPGGTTFNAPDVAVPVIEKPIDGALAAVPGMQALNHAFVNMENIGNDMSPITRKKAKRILVTTIVVGQIVGLRRRFGQ